MDLLKLISSSIYAAVSSAYMLLVFGLLPLVLFFLVIKCLLSWRKVKSAGTCLTVGLFHPYCNAGGGGERVLWCAVKAIQKRYPASEIHIYTGNTDATPDQIRSRAGERFNIHLKNNVQFVYLTQRKWVEAYMYPVFTLLGQSLGSVILGAEALYKFVPDVYIDTMGYAFTLPLFSFLGGSRVGCYVHYPTISTDMLQKVADKTESYNNKQIISRNPLLSAGKLLYYKMFARLYGLCGWCCELTMVNSSWTEGHILRLWKSPSRTVKVYPPCDTTEFTNIAQSDSRDLSVRTVISVAQFRPEKDHPLQLRSFQKLLTKFPSEKKSSVKLILIGSCRDREDNVRVEKLRHLVEELDIVDLVN